MQAPILAIVACFSGPAHLLNYGGVDWLIRCEVSLLRIVGSSLRARPQVSMATKQRDKLSSYLHGYAGTGNERKQSSRKFLDLGVPIPHNPSRSPRHWEEVFLIGAVNGSVSSAMIGSLTHLTKA
jgi:hypothetical protein